MNKFFIATLFTIISFKGIAQDNTIHLEEKSNKPFIVNNKAYSFNERELIFNNQEALKLLSSAKSNITGSQILAGIGGGFLGFTLSDLLLAKRNEFTQEQWDNKKKIRTIFIGGAVAFVALAIPVSKSALKKTRKAVDLENSVLAKEENNNISLKINASTNGLGLALNF